VQGGTYLQAALFGLAGIFCRPQRRGRRRLLRRSLLLSIFLLLRRRDLRRPQRRLRGRQLRLQAVALGVDGPEVGHALGIALLQCIHW